MRKLRFCENGSLVERWQEAAGSLNRAFDYYAEAGDVDRAVAIAKQPFSAALGRRPGVAKLSAPRPVYRVYLV